MLRPGTKWCFNEILILNTDTFYFSVLNLVYKLIINRAKTT